MKTDLYSHPDYYNLDDLYTEEQLLVRDAARAWVKKEVEESVEFAENSPYPEAHELYEDVYTQTDYPYIKEY